MARTPTKGRQAIIDRDGNTCQCCGLPGHEVHHLQWAHDGGDDSPDNLILLCTECHRQAPDADNFLAFQRSGGRLAFLLSSLSDNQRASLFLDLPFKEGVSQEWHLQRVKWLTRFCFPEEY
jgi:5-methylcytosine-specific restriction endonuclease McrA